MLHSFVFFFSGIWFFNLIPLKKSILWFERHTLQPFHFSWLQLLCISIYFRSAWLMLLLPAIIGLFMSTVSCLLSQVVVGQHYLSRLHPAIHLNRFVGSKPRCQSSSLQMKIKHLRMGYCVLIALWQLQAQRDACWRISEITVALQIFGVELFALSTLNRARHLTEIRCRLQQPWFSFKFQKNMKFVLC